MSTDLIIQKYSQALADVAAQGRAGVLAFEIEVVTKIFGTEDAQRFFTSPFNTSDQKLLVAKATLEGRCIPEVFNYIITLVENERVGFIAQINEKFQALVRTQSGEEQGVLYSATQPTEAFKLQVEQKISETLKKKVSLNVARDPNLLSGYKVTVGSLTIDDSAQSYLNKLKEEISRKV